MRLAIALIGTGVLAAAFGAKSTRVLYGVVVVLGGLAFLAVVAFLVRVSAGGFPR